ncbi:Zinc finger C2H2-type [Cinara cedri]|uniref:Zinc finger C2H2-type n=1 Tax=Cinara cedri TaxID=506608 RepID=A0A5E4NGG9_9HEMI|nr:Zinc finger C2H2-type [Cinara cedri]
MEVDQSIENSSISLQLTSNIKEEIEHPSTQTIEIKKEFDLINGCEFQSVITIENDPMESILYQKPKLRKKKYSCYNCGDSSFSKSLLKRHMKVHTGRKVDNDNCPLRFMSTSEEEFKKPSTQTIEIIKEKPYKCEVCEKSFRHKPNLLQHTKIHTGRKPFKCEVCKKSFRRKSHLTEHIRIHTGEKPFECDVCGISFTQKSNLLVHTRTHTGGKKPFKCNVCEKSFKHKSNMLVHTKIHTGENLLKCAVCEKLFGYKSNLLVHTMIHTGEKPFKCEVCNKSFKRKSHLLEHTRIHTRETIQM